MARIIYEKAPESGIALGGLGTGSVELFPDGEFHQWQIANQPRWSTVCNESAADDGESSTGALSFWIRTEEADGTVRIRKRNLFYAGINRNSKVNRTGFICPRNDLRIKKLISKRQSRVVNFLSKEIGHNFFFTGFRYIIFCQV